MQPWKLSTVSLTQTKNMINDKSTKALPEFFLACEQCQKKGAILFLDGPHKSNVNKQPSAMVMIDPASSRGVVCFGNKSSHNSTEED